MLDFARRKAAFSARRFGVGAVVSVGAHLLLLGSAIAVGASHRERRDEGVEVAFVDRPALPPTPPPATPEPSPAEPEPSEDDAPGPLSAAVRGSPKVSSNPSGPEPSEEGSDDEDPYAALPASPSEGPLAGPVSSGASDAGPPGAASASGGAKPAVPKAKGPIPFSADMTTPKLLSGKAPVYTRQALEAHVEGTMIVQCVITTTGAVTNCRVLQTVPFMEEAVLSALATRKYTPVTRNGVALDVAYIFRVHLVMP